MKTDVDLEEDDAAGSFSIVLPFAGVACSKCGQLAPAGPCPECGTKVPPSDEANELVEARQAALGPLAREARGLLEEFDGIAKQQVPLSADQFVSAVIDVRLFHRIGLTPQLGHRLEEVDFEDPKAIGRQARRIVSEHLDHVRGLLEVCRDLAMFDPDGPAGELQDLAFDSGRYGGHVVEALARTVTAETMPEAREGEAELQALLDGFPPGERLSELLPLIEEWALRDFDSRIGLALAQEGRYTDDFGFPDPSRIFAAFADADEPFQKLAARARTYFAHLLEGPPSKFGDEALLVFPAATLASLDRPLEAHRIARDLVTLMRRAWAADSNAVQALVERTTAAGPLVFAAASRVDKALQHLARGAEAGLVDDEYALKELLGAYLELAESHFRTFGALALDLVEIERREQQVEREHPPTLGELEQQLGAAGHRLTDKLAESSDSHLRNAAGHAQYRWDAGSETVIDLRTGAKWSVDDLENAVRGLVGAIAGFDAGYSCFVVDGGARVDPPDWLRAGEAPYASLLLAEAVLGAYGVKVLDISADGSVILVEEPRRVDAARLLPPLAGIATILAPRGTVQVVSATSEEILLEVDAVGLVEAAREDEEVRDLAVFVPLLSVAEYAGHDPLETLLDALALQARVIGMTVLPELQRQLANPPALLGLARRLRYVRRFASSHARAKEKPINKLVGRLGKAEGAARTASLGDRGALSRLLDQLTGLLSWAENRGGKWPPI